MADDTNSSEDDSSGSAADKVDRNVTQKGMGGQTADSEGSADQEARY